MPPIDIQARLKVVGVDIPKDFGFPNLDFSNAVKGGGKTLDNITKLEKALNRLGRNSAEEVKKFDALFNLLGQKSPTKFFSGALGEAAELSKNTRIARESVIGLTDAFAQGKISTTAFRDSLKEIFNRNVGSQNGRSGLQRLQDLTQRASVDLNKQIESAIKNTELNFKRLDKVYKSQTSRSVLDVLNIDPEDIKDTRNLARIQDEFRRAFSFRDIDEGINLQQKLGLDQTVSSVALKGYKDLYAILESIIGLVNERLPTSLANVTKEIEGQAKAQDQLNTSTSKFAGPGIKKSRAASAGLASETSKVKNEQEKAKNAVEDFNKELAATGFGFDKVAKNSGFDPADLRKRLDNLKTFVNADPTRVAISRRLNTGGRPEGVPSVSGADFDSGEIGRAVGSIGRVITTSQELDKAEGRARSASTALANATRNVEKEQQKAKDTIQKFNQEINKTGENFDKVAQRMGVDVAEFRSKLDGLQKFANANPERIALSRQLNDAGRPVGAGSSSSNFDSGLIGRSIKDVKTVTTGIGKSEQAQAIAGMSSIAAATDKIRNEQERARNAVERFNKEINEAGGDFERVAQRSGLNVQTLRKSLDTLQRFSDADPLQLALSRRLDAGGTRASSSAADFGSGEIGRIVRSTNKVTTTIQQLEQGRITFDKFGKSAALAFRRYGSFLAGSAVIFQLQSALTQAFTASIQLERSLTKIEQVLLDTGVSTDSLNNKIRSLSSQFGVSATDLAEGVFTFAQAGFRNIKDLTTVAEELAKIPLTATFGDINSTTEGLIAIFGQFNKQIGDTAEILDVVNQFSAVFAVESSDIFEGVKRGGSAFATTGNSFEQFVALFSVLRESTRESAETLGTFFKSGLGQILQPSSQQQLRNIGVTAQDVIGQLTQLGEIFASDRFSESDQINIARQITGQRQFARVLALVRELSDESTQSRVQDALRTASGSLDASLVPRLDDIGVSLGRVQQQFLLFFDQIIDNDSLKNTIKNFADLAENFKVVVTAAKPLVPLLTAIVGLSTAKAIQKTGFSFLSTLGFLDAATGLGGIGVGRNKNPLGQFFLGSPGANGRRSLNSRNAGKFGLGLGFAGLAGVGLAQAGLNASGVSSANDGLDIASSSILGGIVTGSAIAGFAKLSATLAAVSGPIGLAVGLITAAGLALFAYNQKLDQQRKSLTQAKLAAIDDPFDRLSFLARNTLARNPDSRTTVTGVGGNSRSSILYSLKKITANPNNPDNKILLDVVKQSVSDQIDIARERLLNSSPSTVNEDGNFVVLKEEANDLLRELVSGQLQKEFKSRPEFADNLDLLYPVDINNLVGQLFDQVPERFQKDLIVFAQEQDFGLLEITKALAGFTTSRRRLVLTLDFLNNNLNDAARQLSQVVIDPSALATANFTPSKIAERSIDILSVGLNNFISEYGNALTGFAADSVNYASQLDDFGIDNFIVNISERLAEITGRQDGAIQKDIRKNFGNLLGVLFDPSVGGEDIGKSIADLASSREDVREFVEGIFPKELETKLNESTQKFAEVFNQELSIRRSLTEGLAKSLTDVNKLSDDINNLLVAEALRSASSNNRLGGNSAQRTLNAQINSLSLSSGRAFSSFDAGAGRSAVDSIAERNRIAEELSGLNPTVANSTVLYENLNKAQNKAIIAITQFEIAQSKINTSIGLYDQLINNLIETQRNYISGLENAGQAVQSLTIDDISSQLSAFSKFLQSSGIVSGQIGTAAGISAASAGLSNLNPQEFQSLIAGLTAVGGFNLGNDITGSDIVSQINQALAVPFLAAFRSATTGTDQATAQQSILAELESNNKAIKDAEDQRRELIKQQLEFLKDQKAIAEADRDFRERQLVSLESLTASSIALEQVLIDLNASVTSTLSSLSDKISEGVTSIKDLKNGIENGVATQIQVQPIQVNVNFSGNDIKGVYTERIRNEIFTQFTRELAKVFEDTGDTEVASKIGALGG